MNCADNRKLLSDFYDGLLTEMETERVRKHMMICMPCREIFRDLEQIVTAAAELHDHDKDCDTCPNEKVSWRQFELAALNATDFAEGRQWLRR